MPLKWRALEGIIPCIPPCRGVDIDQKSIFSGPDCKWVIQKFYKRVEMGLRYLSLTLCGSIRVYTRSRFNPFSLPDPTIQTISFSVFILLDLDQIKKSLLEDKMGSANSTHSRHSCSRIRSSYVGCIETSRNASSAKHVLDLTRGSGELACSAPVGSSSRSPPQFLIHQREKVEGFLKRRRKREQFFIKYFFKRRGLGGEFRKSWFPRSLYFLKRISTLKVLTFYKSTRENSNQGP